MSAPAPVYIVSSSSGVLEVFAEPEEAEAFVREHPEARIARHQVRRSMEDSIVIFDRKVVVTQGATVLDRTDVIRQFIDDPGDTPLDADVEYFLDSVDSRWHIIGFGIDNGALDAWVQSVIDEVSALDDARTLDFVGGRGQS